MAILMGRAAPVELTASATSLTTSVRTGTEISGTTKTRFSLEMVPEILYSLLRFRVLHRDPLLLQAIFLPTW